MQYKVYSFPFYLDERCLFSDEPEKDARKQPLALPNTSFRYQRSATWVFTALDVGQAAILNAQMQKM